MAALAVSSGLAELSGRVATLAALPKLGQSRVSLRTMPGTPQIESRILMVAIKTASFDLCRTDATDPKHAPFGSIRTTKNLRHRKGGRLGLRNGYVAATMTTANGTLRAYDLFPHAGRLCALGSDATTPDTFPVDLYERPALTSGQWRTNARSTERGQLIHPFVGLREVASPPQIRGGVTRAPRSASGAGYICLAYVPAGAPTTFVTMIVRESDDLLIYREVRSYASGAAMAVCFSVDRFYLLQEGAIYSFTPGTSTAWSDISASGLNASATTWDLRAVTNPTTAAIVVAFDQGATTDLSVMVFSSAGAQIGTTCTVAAITTAHVSVQADQTGNVIGLLTVEAANAVRLRTFNFSGVLGAGPTAAGSTGTWAELLLYTTGGASPGLSYILAIADASSPPANTVVETRSTANVLGSTITLTNLVIQTQVIPWTTYDAPQGCVLGALRIADGDGTNFLVYCSPSSSGITVHAAPRDYLVGRGILIANRATAGLSLDASTGRACWTSMRDTGTGGALGDIIPTLTTFAYQSARRRQTVSAGGLTYLAQGAPAVYDGKLLTEVGFGEPPQIVSLTASNSTGSLTNSASYDYLVVWSYTLSDGQYYQSAPCELSSVTLGAADDTVDVVIRSPHASLALTAARFGSEVIGEVYRTVWDATAGSKGAIFRLVDTVSLAAATTYGGTVTYTDTTADSQLDDEGVIYTQGSRGPLSGPLEHNAPRASEYVAATESRLLWGGQPRRFEYQISKEAFLGEPFSHSEFSAFFGQVHAPIYAVAALGETKYVFTSEEIYAVQGIGPDDTGAGTLGAPVRLPVPSGLKVDGWRSLLETPQGLFFQLDSNKLYRLNGATPEWIGADVQDTLVSYPDVSGTARSRADGVAAFAAQSSNATDARILVYDLERGTWLEDVPPLTASSGIAALCTYGRTMAYCSGGAVFVQSETGFTDGTATPIVAQLVTNPLYPFGLGGYGLILEALLSFEFRGACDLAARVSYDDGATYTTLPTFTLTGTAGASMRRKWTLPQSDATSVQFEFTVTPTGTGTEGICFSNLALATIASAGLGEPDPADCA